jgi:hypothetical protein
MVNANRKIAIGVKSLWRIFLRKSRQNDLNEGRMVHIGETAIAIMK